MQLLRGLPLDDRVHAGAYLHACVVCVDILDAAWVWLGVGLMCILRGLVVLALGLVLLDQRCFLQLIFCWFAVLWFLGLAGLTLSSAFNTLAGRWSRTSMRNQVRASLLLWATRPRLIAVGLGPYKRVTR